MELHGERIRQGDRILLLMGAANRDPAKFDDPERFVPTRDPNPHLSFSHGIHFCLGAPLARMEAEIAFNEMLRRFPEDGGAKRQSAGSRASSAAASRRPIIFSWG
jgi:cytochrome P450